MFRPRTPFEARIASLTKLFPPPPWHPAAAILEFEARLAAERDLAFRAYLAEIEAAFPSIMLSRTDGGSGFPISQTLRSFFTEYAGRMVRSGPHSFPSSFNVLEGFHVFNHDYFLFDLREERDHLLRLDEYLD